MSLYIYIYIYNLCTRYLFYKKLSKIMHTITTHQNSCIQHQNRTCSMMAPQSLNPPKTKKNSSGLRELKIP